MTIWLKTLFKAQNKVLQVLTQQAKSVTSFQAHADISTLRFTAQEYDEFAEKIMRFYHCQALKYKI